MNTPHRNITALFLRTAIFAVFVLLPMMLNAQTGATVYQQGTVQYGSLSAPLFTVAQNTTPAPVTLAPSSSSFAPSAPPPAPVVVPSPVVSLPFDPYAETGGITAGLNNSSTINNNVLGSSGYTGNSGIYSGNFDRFVPETYAAMRKFREATRCDYTFLPGGKEGNSFGMSEIDLRMQLAIPCRYIPNNAPGQSGPGYFLVAPGANLVWWDGPVGPPNMSPNGFGAFLDLGMQPQITENFGLNAWFRFGVFSDFKHVASEALRYQGRVEGNFTVSPEMKLTAGLIYMDRARIRLMPTGGVIWTPRDDLIVRLVFPNPKISKRLWKSSSEWWGYVQADYGGGCWSIDGLGKTDYNDIKIGTGVEFETYTRVGGYFEFGGSFGRELYTAGHKWASPPSVLYLKTGFIF